MRICLYWNATAGGGTSLDDLKTAIMTAGHEIVRAVDDESDLPSDMGGIDCVVVAGGDGTVARAARALTGGSLPLAILPRGTANNIASSLELPDGDAAVIERWHAAKTVSIDVGELVTLKETRRFIESVGCGLVTACIEAGRATLSKNDPESHLANARQLYLDTLQHTGARRYDIALDGETLSGEFLVIEALNVPSIGPKLELTTDANAADGLLSVVAIAESERAALVAYLTALRTGAVPAAPFKSWRVNAVEIRGADRMHVDDQIVDVSQSPIRIRVEHGALPILA